MRKSTYNLANNVWFWNSTELIVSFVNTSNNQTIAIEKRNMPFPLLNGEAALKEDIVNMLPGKTEILPLQISTKGIPAGSYKVHVQYSSSQNSITSYIGKPRHPYRHYANIWTGTIISNNLPLELKN